jgi:hypothetical protein
VKLAPHGGCASVKMQFVSAVPLDDESMHASGTGPRCSLLEWMP